MNYKKIYYQIIENANKRNKTKESYKLGGIYVENHHILPKSLGGTDDVHNLVYLTAREHFICHYLLTRMYKKETLEWYKTNNAFIKMKCFSFNQKRYYNSRLYEALRDNFSSTMSFMQRGEKNSQYGKMWICNSHLKENKKIGNNESIPDGWEKGRNLWKIDEREAIRVLKEQQRKEETKKISENLFEKFIDSDLSLNKFAKSVDVTSSSLSQRFKKHIPEYKEKSIERKKFKTL